MPHKGTESIEQIKESMKKLVIAGKKISQDKKIGLDDIAHVIALASEFPAMLDSFKKFDEALQEAKDLDVNEAIALIQSFHVAVKEIEQA